MFSTKHPRLSGMLVVLTFLMSSAIIVGQEKKKDTSVPAHARRIIWQAPADTTSLDLFLGPGGEAMKPDLSRVTFVKVETGGFSTKYRVKDGSGRTWVVKVGQEARPETAAVRLAWAAGYVTEVNYLVPCVQIAGAPKPHKKEYECANNGHANVRFEARPDNIKRLDEWSWKSNPFTGTKELKGLIVLMALLNNWDLKDTNNKVLLVNGDQPELHYIVSDLGATFGKTGGVFGRSRNEPDDYVKAKFVAGVDGKEVKFAYSGKEQVLMRGITVDDAHWVGSLLSQLSDQQLTDAFRAANFTSEEIQMLVPATRARIDQLVNLR